jgi:hypothetical protein
MEQAKSFFEDSRLAGAVPRSFKSFLFQTKYAQLRDFFHDSGASTGIHRPDRTLGNQKALLVKVRGLF